MRLRALVSNVHARSLCVYLPRAMLERFGLCAGMECGEGHCVQRAIGSVSCRFRTEGEIQDRYLFASSCAGESNGDRSIDNGRRGLKQPTMTPWPIWPEAPKSSSENGATAGLLPLMLAIQRRRDDIARCEPSGSWGGCSSRTLVGHVHCSMGAGPTLEAR